jgi:predicted TIM-barrel fold metal-dependent hydrolase
MERYQIVPKPQCVVEEHKINKAKFPVIDIHTHLGKLVIGDDYQNLYDMEMYQKELKKFGVVHSINLDGVFGKDLDKMMKLVNGYDDITTFCWIDVTRIDDPDFDAWVISHLKRAFELGCRGIKMWKVISLNQKDKSGNYIRTDDPRLDVVYDTAAMLKMPILIHIADPTAFFEPVDYMNERYDELNVHPDWQFGKPDQLTFQELMEMQDNMIEHHPDTTFVVAHVGSYAENLKHVAERLDRYPNMYIDTAGRFGELGRVPYSARAFFIKYQDRILYGTDETPLDFDQYPITFRFLETKDEYFPYWKEGEIPGQGWFYIYGIDLPDEVLEKVYYKNALKVLNKTDLEEL